MESPNTRKALMERYGVDERLAEIMIERQKVYGDPEQNYHNIAQLWAGLLQPWAHLIAVGKPVPPHVIALMMSALKMSRQRITFHADNFDDLANYQLFAKAWQREFFTNAQTTSTHNQPCISPRQVLEHLADMLGVALVPPPQIEELLP